MVSKKKIQLAFLALICLASCSDSNLQEYRSRKSSDSITTTERAFDVAIEYTELGNLRAIMYSPELSGKKQAEDPYMEMKKGVEVEFIDDNGALESYLTSEYAISFNKSKKVILKRNVDVMNIKGERFLTEELTWDQKTKKVRTNKDVWIFTDGQITHGTGFESDQSFSEYTITGFVGQANVNNHDSLSRNRATLLSRRRNKHN
ncbi:MAG: LPS export ABC transporter periplasmic protein LptC [Bacteroidia bacterium]|nr:LPS export ABC transporter periplasmic protein LptC [Bacteroidia bacterium]